MNSGVSQREGGLEADGGRDEEESGVSIVNATMPLDCCLACGPSEGASAGCVGGVGGVGRHVDDYRACAAHARRRCGTDAVHRVADVAADQVRDSHSAANRQAHSMLPSLPATYAQLPPWLCSLPLTFTPRFQWRTPTSRRRRAARCPGIQACPAATPSCTGSSTSNPPRPAHIADRKV